MVEEEESGLKVVQLKNGRSITLQDKESCKNSLESGFGEWDLIGKLLYAGHACWLLKDLTWILLISPAAFFFGAGALLLVGVSVVRRLDGGASGKIYQEARAEALIGVIHFLWLLFNYLSMVTEFVYAEPDVIPTYAQSLVNLSDCDGGPCVDTNEILILLVRIGFGLTVFVWIVACCVLLYKWIEPPRYVAQGFAFQTCLLEGGWISFWVLKDFAWTFDEAGFPYALAAYCIHFVLLVTSLVSSSAHLTLWDGIDAAELQRIGDTFTRIDLVILSYVLWSLSSLLWLLMEETFDEAMSWRYAAAGVTLVSLALFFAGYKQAAEKGRLISFMKYLNESPESAIEEPNEDKTLYGARAVNSEAANTTLD